jgi:hypothetical protein
LVAPAEVLPAPPRVTHVALTKDLEEVKVDAGGNVVLPIVGKKRQGKAARKHQTEAARNKRWLSNNDLKYGIVDGTQHLFSKPREEDLLFDPDHDKFVLESALKYDYLLLRDFKKTKKLPFSQGIIDKASAKKHLGEKFDAHLILVKGSVCYPGKIRDW